MIRTVSLLLLVTLTGCRDAQQDAAATLKSSGIVTQLSVAGEVTRVDATEAELPADFWTTLTKFPKLKALILTSVTFSDRNLASLDSFESLESLDLSYTKVSSVGLTHLTRLSSLRNLALNGGTLDEDALGALRQMRQLRSLALVETNLTDGQIQQLQSDLAGCLVAN